jgi:hypothetical protein
VSRIPKASQSVVYGIKQVGTHHADFVYYKQVNTAYEP